MWKHLNKKKIKRWLILSLLFILLIYFAIPISKPLFKETTYSTLIKAKNENLIHGFLNENEQWHFPPDNLEIPEKLEISVLTFEDESFYKHIGVNFRAIGRAIVQNFIQRKIVSGASTIPMQLARMSRPKNRTYFNKLKEIFFAIKLDLHYSKGELLKLYLHHAPYGGNVKGYRTASYKFFGKDARALTWSEAATLAVLPNAPGLIFPSSTPDKLKLKRDALLKKLLEKEQINAQTYQLAKLEPIPDQFIAFDSQAPHLARKLKFQYPNHWVINTTIDEYIQKQCNYIASRYRKKYKPYGIFNMAILVTDTKSGAVKAYVGSSDFFDDEHNGQVDGVISPRSSGSTLKPFLYALSMDQGLILPESFIHDIPTYFEGFSPKNASREYLGIVTAREALVYSLNIPAVRLLNYFGVYQFYSYLKEAGISTLFREADEYGLTLVLGGAEVNMWDLTILFRGIANGGYFCDNYTTDDEKNKYTTQLISTGSCFLTLDILKDLKRPGSEYFWERFSGSKPFAWKTGTSYGHKDAWAIGVNPENTIAVWVGNFDGEGNKNLSGARTAGPILFEILEIVSQKDTIQWFEKSEMDFRKMKICSLSGFRASSACTDIVEYNVPYGMKTLKQCNYHQFRYFSKDERYQCCSKCWQLIGKVKKSVLIYPPDVAYYLRKKGIFVETLTQHYPYCSAYRSEQSLKILYPNEQAKLFLPRDFNGKIQQVVCKVGHTGAGENIYWYLDNHYLGKTIKDHKMAILFKEGWNLLKVVDETGSEDSRKIFASKK